MKKREKKASLVICPPLSHVRIGADLTFEDNGCTSEYDVHILKSSFKISMYIYNIRVWYSQSTSYMLDTPFDLKVIPTYVAF